MVAPLLASSLSLRLGAAILRSGDLIAPLRRRIAERRAEAGAALAAAGWPSTTPAFQAFLVTRSLAAADGCLDDALGQLATGDVTGAVLSARQALGHAVDALLESRGVYGSQLPKWRARRLAEARLPDLPFERYRALETMASFDQERPEAWVEEVVVLCRALSLRAEI
ncbi:hypothetical protein ABZ470_29605 [Streptosporangium sp. NPDC020072]|uniref:hypothetical protein n=1 Tax=Streptosporangium sp. NPDC020072 TaxID=3154788 RepID=UPI00343A237C